MKNIFLIAAVLVTAFMQNSFAQTGTKNLPKDAFPLSDSAFVFKNIIDSYLDLKNALTRDDNDSARIAAGQLYNAVKKVTMGSLPSKYHSAWMQYNEKLSSDAEHIKKTDDIDNQREYFKSLSVNVYQFLKAVKVNSSGQNNLYYQYCPMVKAYWVSEMSNIVNPYEGSMMPTCGTTKDVLKSVK